MEDINRYGLLLPIGSVVKLKNMDKKIMVNGLLSVSQDVVKDYSGCLYPEGMLSGNECVLFDQEDIEELIFKGYVDEDEISFKKSLNDNVELMKSALKKYKEEK